MEQLKGASFAAFTDIPFGKCFTLCGLYYKHVTVKNYASSGVSKLKASLNDDARVVIYDPHMFIVQATDWDINLGWVCCMAVQESS